ncbi:uncharacterized protein LOC110974719 [Acanthaster planci]|uniref:Uncharacterized protein LOC110974719 n=1 Tax=Acanthaster planci TaxID=133434 RepID=A0A8B7XN12_ACAPL|nr:uncharacterized protein LOC110974719 [Acanthaster planci]
MMCDWAWCRVPFLLLTVVVFTVTLGCKAIVYMQSRCGQTVRSHGDIIFSQTSLYYQPKTECSLTLLAPDSRQKIRLKFMELDITSEKPCTMNFLEVRGTALIHGTRGGRVFCGRDPPQDVTSTQAWLELKFKSGGTQRGRGFRMVFTAIYQGIPCTEPGMFHCISGDCISSRLRCDSVDHCGDGSDEAQTPYDTCKDETGTLSTYDLNLTRTLFSILGVTFSVLSLGAVLWQSSAYLWKKWRRSKPSQGEQASLMEHRFDDAIDPVRQTANANMPDEETSDLSNYAQIGNGFDREGEQRMEGPPYKNNNVHKTVGRFIVTDVPSKEGIPCKAPEIDENSHGVADEDEQKSEKAAKIQDRVNIGRFSVQKIQSSTSDISRLPLPMTSIAITDPTKQVKRSQVGFLLNTGESTLDRRTSKVKFVFHGDGEGSSNDSSAPDASTKGRGSILKKNPKYPDLQSYESKLTLSLKSDTSFSDEEDLTRTSDRDSETSDDEAPHEEDV